MNDPLQTQFRLPGPDPLPAPKDPALPESRTPDLQFQTQPEDSTLPSIPKTLWGLSQESQGHSCACLQRLPPVPAPPHPRGASGTSAATECLSPTGTEQKHLEWERGDRESEPAGNGPLGRAWAGPVPLFLSFPFWLGIWPQMQQGLASPVSSDPS